jgi:hypothetical protein
MLEFTFALLPLLMMVFVLMDAAWAIYAKSTLAYAVRTGVRTGITITGTQATAAGSDLTSMVKHSVQASANGLLGHLPTDAGWGNIKVHYYKPPDPGSAAACVDVSGLSNGNDALNIMQVSIQGFSLHPLVPRLFGLHSGVDNASTSIGAIAADLIEPSRDLPPIGVAP